MRSLKRKYIFIIVALLVAANNLKAGNFFGNLKAEIDTVIINIHHKQAIKKFEGLAYVKAISKYEKLVEKGFSPDSLRQNLALSYLKVNETVKSEELYSVLVANNEAETMDYYYYAQALKYNKKYDEADKWIEKYRELKNEDSRGELQYEAAPIIKEIYSEEKYKIEPAYFNSEYSEFGATVEGDMVIFTSGRKDQSIIQYEYSWKGKPYLDVFAANVEKQVLYKEPELLSKGINSRFHDGPIQYGPEGNEVFITRNNFQYGMPKYSEKKENHFKLYVRKKSNDKWGDVEELLFNSDEYSCGHPAISTDNTRLYFASDMPGGFGNSDIYYVTRTNEGWSEPINLGASINTEGDEMFPFVSAAGQLYFSSNGHLGLGGLDIFIAEEIGESKYQIQNMGYPLNSSSDDFSFYLMKNDHDGYFASNREGGKGDDDIYKFKMLNKPTFSFTLVCTTIDNKTGDAIPSADVSITVEDGKELYLGKSDSKGLVEMEVNPGETYNISALKEKYSETNFAFLADKSKAENNTVYVDIPMDIVQEWGVYGYIYEKESGNGVSDVEIILSETGTNVEIIDITDSSGNFKKLLKAETDYDILLKKKKFFTRRGAFSTKGMEPGWIDIKEFLEVEMEEIVVGKTIEIPNIYYDLAKWNIREDAAIELDKVVQFLLDNETITIELGSHTDARGSNSSNQTLSQKRAESAVNYIVTNGISYQRITAKGYGESKLKNRCADGVRCSEEEHQENRRTEIKIVDF